MTDYDLPKKLFLDPRVAKTLPQTSEDGEALASEGVKFQAYIREDHALDMLRQARLNAQGEPLPDEYIAQISGITGIVYGLSNKAKLYALGADGWAQIAEATLLPVPGSGS